MLALVNLLTFLYFIFVRTDTLYSDRLHRVVYVHRFPYCRVDIDLSSLHTCQVMLNVCLQGKIFK